MDRNEIKKYLYKEKPKALLNRETDDTLYYVSITNKGYIEFVVPKNDMGTAKFTSSMDAQLLIRWLKKDN